MNPLTRALRKLIENSGYRITSRSFFGQNSFADFHTLLQDVARPIVIDVGAFIGEFALALLGSVPKAEIFCFEPDPATYARLVKATDSLPCVKPVNLALGESTGMLDFHFNKGPATNSFLKASASANALMAKEDSNCREVSKVHITRLDDYARENSISKVHLLKTDTQGFELSVLRGAAQLFSEHRIKAVYSEVFFKEFYENQCYFHDVHAYLIGHGLSFCGFYDEGRTPSNELMWADALYIDPQFA